MAKTTYRVTGMTCEHCERAVDGEVSAIDGVAGVEVSAATGVLVVDTGVGSPADDDAVLAAVEEAGYEAARAV
ncbi:heavy-metal-associated domain-containing protein [Microbacterium betulae]|uniref:Heavy-metal-associated domain-containing protein n=1 Tax=Microbacterium betulae TaxID=2981139 RepID=A0AA97FIQ9_9MICO|nr:heavy-metal-associated domain-containing protein [Microbacterium sp. AB]WOF23374.1 heavy-metal-associated domain-containing protein [Microbacterium sp. AB]